MKEKVRFHVLALSRFLLLTLLILVLPLNASAITFYTDQLAWQSDINNLESFTTNANNVATADEVSSLPGNNAQLGNVLTFSSANTGLSRSFSIEALQSGANLVFNETEGAVLPEWQDVISIGDIGEHEDDDWEIKILSGPSLSAFGFFLDENIPEAGESLQVFGQGDSFLGQTTNIPSSSRVFMGVISDQAITRIYFDEDSGGDDIGISDFQFATAAIPEPASLFLLGSGLVGMLGLRRWRK